MKIVIAIGIIIAALMVLGVLLYLLIAHFMFRKFRKIGKKTNKFFDNDFKF